MSTDHAPRLLTRLARWHGLGRSSLRRTTDRIEATATVVLVILAVLIVPVAIIIARGTYQRELAEAAAMASHRTPVTAVLLTDAGLQHATPTEPDLTPATTALARWQLPHGQQRSAPLWVSADRHAGDQVSIWIDQHGNRTDPPQPPGLRRATALIIGVELVLGGWVLLGALWWTFCAVLNRINSTWWDVQWARTGPGWSRRTWQ
jgi:hypothetical protein